MLPSQALNKNRLFTAAPNNHLSLDKIFAEIERFFPNNGTVIPELYVLEYVIQNLVAHYPDNARTAAITLPGCGQEKHCAHLVWKFAERGWTTAVKILLETLINPNSNLDYTCGYSLATAAAFNGHLETLRTIISYGANISQRDIAAIEGYRSVLVKMQQSVTYLDQALNFLRAHANSQENIEKLSRDINNSQNASIPKFLNTIEQYENQGFAIRFLISKLSPNNSPFRNQVFLSAIERVLNSGNEIYFSRLLANELTTKLNTICNVNPTLITDILEIVQQKIIAIDSLTAQCTL